MIPVGLRRKHRTTTQTGHQNLLHIDPNRMTEHINNKSDVLFYSKAPDLNPFPVRTIIIIIIIHDTQTSNLFPPRTPKPTPVRPRPRSDKNFAFRYLMKAMTKLVTHSVSVLLMDGITVKINYCPFSCGPPGIPLKDPWGSPDPALTSTAI